MLFQMRFRGVHNFWSEKCGVLNMNSHEISFYTMWLCFSANQNPPNCSRPRENVWFQVFFFPFKEQSCFTALLKSYFLNIYLVIYVIFDQKNVVSIIWSLRKYHFLLYDLLFQLIRTLYIIQKLQKILNFNFSHLWLKQQTYFTVLLKINFPKHFDSFLY